MKDCFNFGMYEKEKDDFFREGFVHFNSQIENEIQTLGHSLLMVARERFSLSLQSLEDLHQQLPPSALNDFRLQMISELNAHPVTRMILEKHAGLAQDLLGPDLAIQKQVNLVISMPGDETSQIPLHSDVWTGHSAFEINFWIPLTNVEGDMSMFILPLARWRSGHYRQVLRDGTLKSVFSEMKQDLYYVNLPAGKTFVFWHHLPHGNHTHQHAKTRWSLNVRVKNLFTPYGEKSLGEYFTPWKKSQMTNLVLGEKEFLL